MKEKIKQILVFVIIIGGLFTFYTSIFAHPGNTASDDCHYCRTNCDYWGVAWNQRHCHGGSGNSISDSGGDSDSGSIWWWVIGIGFGVYVIYQIKK